MQEEHILSGTPSAQMQKLVRAGTFSVRKVEDNHNRNLADQSPSSFELRDSIDLEIGLMLSETRKYILPVHDHD